MTRSIKVAAVILGLAACNAAEPVTSDRAEMAADMSSVPSAAPSTTRMAVAAAPPPMEEGLAAQAQTTIDRKVIRTAQLRIELEDVARAVKSADSIAAAAQGVLANSNSTHGDNGARESHLMLRVPAEHFAVVLEGLRALGRVRIDNTNAEDVTRSYNDLEIRLAVKRDVVARLRALLANRTARLADLLAAERELGRAVAELEQMEGERRYLDNQIAMTTIHVTFFHNPIVGPRGFFDPITIAVRETLVMLGKSIATVISVAVFIAPWMALVAGAWWLRRFRRRRTATG